MECKKHLFLCIADLVALGKTAKVAMEAEESEV